MNDHRPNCTSACAKKYRAHRHDGKWYAPDGGNIWAYDGDEAAEIYAELHPSVQRFAIQSVACKVFKTYHVETESITTTFVRAIAD